MDGFLGPSRVQSQEAIAVVYERLEAAGYFYAIRLPGNAVLREKAAHLQTRPVGRPQDSSVRHAEEPGRRAMDADGGRLTSPNSGRFRDHTHQPVRQTLDRLAPSGDHEFRR